MQTNTDAVLTEIIKYSVTVYSFTWCRKAPICLQIENILLNMTPLGTRRFPSKQWGEGGSAETLVPLETICWKSPRVTRLSLLQAFPAGFRGTGGGEWLNVFLVVPFFTQHTLVSALFVYIWGSFGRRCFNCVSRTALMKSNTEWVQSFCCRGATRPFPVHIKGGCVLVQEKKANALVLLPGAAWYMVAAPPRNDSVPNGGSDREGNTDERRQLMPCVE